MMWSSRSPMQNLLCPTIGENDTMCRARFHCCVHHVAVHVGILASETTNRTPSFQKHSENCQSNDSPWRWKQSSGKFFGKNDVNLFQLFLVNCSVPCGKANNRGNLKHMHLNISTGWQFQRGELEKNIHVDYPNQSLQYTLNPWNRVFTDFLKNHCIYSFFGMVALVFRWFCFFFVPANFGNNCFETSEVDEQDDHQPVFAIQYFCTLCQTKYNCFHNKIAQNCLTYYGTSLALHCHQEQFSNHVFLFVILFSPGFLQFETCMGCSMIRMGSRA